MDRWEQHGKAKDVVSHISPRREGDAALVACTPWIRKGDPWGLERGREKAVNLDYMVESIRILEIYRRYLQKHLSTFYPFLVLGFTCCIADSGPELEFADSLLIMSLPNQCTALLVHFKLFSLWQPSKSFFFKPIKRSNHCDNKR